MASEAVRWEYLVEREDTDSADAEALAGLARALNWRGGHGWELAGVIAATGGRVVWVFKRPAREATDG